MFDHNTLKGLSGDDIRLIIKVSMEIYKVTKSTTYEQYEQCIISSVNVLKMLNEMEE